MSCKYCEPLPSTGKTEPLMVLGKNCECRIRGNVMTLTCYGALTGKTIDHCPVCGESLRPFGPAWGHGLKG